MNPAGISPHRPQLWPGWPVAPLIRRRAPRALLAGPRHDAPASHGHLATHLVARILRRDALPRGRCLCAREVAHSGPDVSFGHRITSNDNATSRDARGASRACFGTTAETGCCRNDPSRRASSNSVVRFVGRRRRAAALARGIERVARAPLDPRSQTNQRPGMARRSRARDARQRMHGKHSSARASRCPHPLRRGLFPATDCLAHRGRALGSRRAARRVASRVRASAKP